MSEHFQVWVRNDKGQVYGPLSPPSVELLIDNGIIGGRMQVSTDGLSYVYPGRVPGLRMIFPKDTWGETVVPGDELDAQWSQVVVPPAVSGSLGAAGSHAPAGGPVGVPGGPVGAPGGPVAGPGVRAGPGTARPGPGRPAATVVPAARPPPVVGAPAVAAPPRSTASVADFMSAATGGPAVPPMSSASGVRAAPPMSSVSGVRAAPPMSSASGVRAVAAPVPEAAAFQPPPESSGSGVRAAPAPASSSSVVRASPLPPPTVGDLEMPASGELAQTSSARLYCIAAATEQTGLLTLKLNDRELVVHFRKGNPEFLDTTHPEDSLDTFLVKQRLATPEQIQQAEAQASRFGGELLGALFGLGLLNPNAVFQHLGQRASLLLFKALNADHGSFTFDLEDFPAAKSMPLGNKWAVYLEAMRKVPSVEVRMRLGSVIDNPVMKAAGRVAVTDLRLTPQETRSLNYFDGVRSLNQLTREHAAEAEAILRAAWMLVPLELISFADVTLPSPKEAPPPPPPPPRPAAVPGPPVMQPPPAAPPRPATVPGPPVMKPPAGAAPGNPVNIARPANAPYPGARPEQPATAPAVAPPPQPAPAAAPPQRPPPPVMKPTVTAAPAAPVNTALEIKQLEETYAAMKTANFFEVLGIKREADANAVKMAYLKAARSYHPDTVPPGSPEALMKVKADIFALIGEANRTLSDAGLKANYIADLEAGGTAGEKVDVEKLLRAEELFQKGRVLVQNRKAADAVKVLDEAIACNAEEAEFYAWRGYAKYLAATDRKLVQVDVMRDLNLCIAKNPNVAAAYYFMGYLQKANGDEKAALSNFKKCVSLDPRHIDAAREVRMMTQKK